MKKILNIKLLLAMLCVAATATAAHGQITEVQQETSRQRALKRVTYEIKYLASDELGGRQPGTPGIELAEKFIVDAYKEAGLKTPKGQDNYFQEFGVGGTRTLKKDSAALTLQGPDGETKLKLGQDFAVLQGRRNYDLDKEVVFIGYGINAEEDHNYNEYGDVDVKDKIVVIMRHEPQQNDPDSVFDGKEVSQHSYLRTKIARARFARAAGIIFVNDPTSAPNADRDELSAYDQFGSQTQTIPFVHVKQNVIDDILKKSPLVVGDGVKLDSLKKVESRIDDTLEPVSQKINGWTASMASAFDQKQTMTNNIIGVIEGEGPNADETIVIGGHYDHLGMGAYGSRAPGRKEIHNGADDNATGTVGIMELARRFAARDKKPGRRLVFIAFTAEEMGLLGARHYVENPIYPLEKTVAMVNFDMIGWLRDGKLTVYNWNSSPQFEPVLDEANMDFELNLQKPPRGFGGSDHLPFFQKGIPVMFLHTGLTSTYHTPDDDFETLDCDGALKVIEFTENVVDGLANLEEAPKFGAPKPLRLGVMLSNDVGEGAVKIEGVTSGSIAEKAGLQKGDVILDFGGTTVTSRRQVTRGIQRDKGKTVKVKIKRGDAEMTLNVILKN